MTLLRPLALLLFAAFTSAPAYAADLGSEDFFKGKTYAYGSFGAINGTSSFRVDLTGHVRGKVLTLREDFRYDDGERDTKTWVFTRTGPNTYSGTREDVLGETTVRLSGNTARFTHHRVDLNPGGKPNIVPLPRQARAEGRRHPAQHRAGNQVPAAGGPGQGQFRPDACRRTGHQTLTDPELNPRTGAQ